jgi:Holliday junction resolvase
MSEAKFQAKLIKQLEVFGWYVIKLITTNKNGIPDLLCLKEGKCMFIEVKTDEGVLSKLQEFRINEIKKIGVDCQVVKPENVNFLLNNLQNQ